MSYRPRNLIQFQRRHFEFIAQTLAAIPSPTLKANMAIRFGKALKDTNPRFDSGRFFTVVTKNEVQP